MANTRTRERAPAGMSAETVGRILEWIERAAQDRSEVKADMDRVSKELSTINAQMERQSGILSQIEKRTEILDGDKGLANRMFMAESQLRSHEEKLAEIGVFVDGARALFWKLVGYAVAAAAVSGGVSSKLIDWLHK